MSQPLALVTGANKGIGFEVARQIAKSGYVVLLGARNPTSGREAQDALTREGLDVRFAELDVTRMQSIAGVAARIEADFGKLDVLVNNAGASQIRMMGRRAECVLMLSSACCKRTSLARWR